MRLHSFAVHRYRSLRAIRMDLGTIDVFCGPNGAGKSNLYNALRLLRGAAANTLAEDILLEGGMGSALWSGRMLKGEKRRIRIEAELRDDETATDFRYRLEIGIPPPVSAGFLHEPHVKEEELTVTVGTRPVPVLIRDRANVRLRDASGSLSNYEGEVLPSETALGILADEGRSPEIALFRRVVGRWRFYHGFRTDSQSPLRGAALAAVAPALAEDGSNLAAVFATLAHVAEDRHELDRAVADALQGARLVIPPPIMEATFGFRLPDFPEREFSARELSDGQLRFLALCGALLSYRLPPLVALNEPETSLHPGMIPPLAALIARAAEKTQVWVVTHSAGLAEEISRLAGCKPSHVFKQEGETRISGLRLDGSRSET
ncbi:AAA family ATPase [Gellertiella hungarica]|uniref:Putative ATPase n=1 Tax=Gellertiella hungarica TaxID=1572859 RepID=A0A7W6NK99_9HYPH|nr:AAA family ATPase [Gellertiella hungarica]MBB4065210.1 putative ATPase [Gellertiella hungarica]